MSHWRSVLRTRRRCSTRSSPTAPILRAYNPQIEDELCRQWKAHDRFSLPATVEPTFSTILPPPNVTGALHLGHAVSVTVGDVICRWSRMRGERVVWVPGTDHAGIATQSVVERDLSARQLTRHQLGRDKFVEEIQSWKRSKGEIIVDQLSRLGASVDWRREYFTLDEIRSRAVSRALVRLWEGGLVYRAESLVSWCCHLRSAISDIEVNHFPVDGPTRLKLPNYERPVTFGQLDYFAYRVENSDEEIVVATTRLETMLGDVAIAVHPSDSRYSRFRGNRVIHPFTGVSLPVIFDEKVDPQFGTGAVKVTPAHDSTDFDMAKRHRLTVQLVVTEDGRIGDNFGNFSKMKRFEAREAVRTKLDCLGLFRRVEPHKTTLPMCSRSGDVIEFLPKPQWFIKSGEMAGKAMEAVRNGDMIIEPNSHNKVWFSWLENIKDWCISRQLWWGHRLPFYRCTGGGEEIWLAADNEENARAEALRSLGVDRVDVEREHDVVDTWFSSALLPMSCFYWPDQKNNFDKYYPMSTLVTGHDILFFWVARMTMLGLQLTGTVPFKRVFLHSLVCDSQGKKMSKSLGNVIDPLDVIEGCTLEDLDGKVQKSYEKGVIRREEAAKARKSNRSLFPKGIPQCGADALRFSLLSQNVKNHFINFNVNDCQAVRLFCNKIWQGHKFAHLWCDKLRIADAGSGGVAPLSTELVDVWILSKLSEMVDEVNRGLEAKDFHNCTSALRGFLYGSLCDVYIEAIKPTLFNGSEQAETCCRVLLFCYDVALRCLSPFMPFVSAILYDSLAGRIYASIDSAVYPENLNLSNKAIETQMNYALEIVGLIRQLKSERSAAHRKSTERGGPPATKLVASLSERGGPPATRINFPHEEPTPRRLNVVSTRWLVRGGCNGKAAIEADEVQLSRECLLPKVRIRSDRFEELGGLLGAMSSLTRSDCSLLTKSDVERNTTTLTARLDDSTTVYVDIAMVLAAAKQPIV